MRRWILVGLCLALLPLRVAHGQEGGGVVRDLLAASRSRLNDLQFREADSIAQAVLDYPSLKRADRVQALQLAAGARFPEQPSGQDRAAALGVLRQLVRIAPGTPLPREFAWPGLDSLYLQVKRQVFGAAASPRASTVLTGPDDRGAIPVVASRPAVFTLGARDANGVYIKLDSIGPVTEGALRFSIIRDMRQLLRSGQVSLFVAAIDPEWNDTIQIRFEGTVDAPPIDLMPRPRDIAATDILPETTRPKRIGGIVGGLFLAAGTIAASQLLREEPFKTGGPPRDARATTLGVTLGLGTAVGVWLLDKGSKIPKNIDANTQTRKAYDDAVAYAKTENERRINNYRGELKLDTEPK